MAYSADIGQILDHIGDDADHRVIDGAQAARFNAYLGQILGDFRRVLL